MTAPAAPSASGAPATESGRYCRAVARDEAPLRGTPEVTDEARHFWEVAFGLAARRRFDPDSPLAEITRTVTAAVQGHAAAALSPIDAEMLLRAALGEQVPLGDLDPIRKARAHLLLFATLTDELALSDAELDTLIIKAESGATA